MTGLMSYGLIEKENSGDLKYMVWSSQSPDLNSIELLWDEFDREVRKKCPTSKDSLWNAIKASWNVIRIETIQNLLARMLILFWPGKL